MNQLLTGGTGYIGRHTAVELSELDRQIVLSDNLSNSSDSVAENLAQITGKLAPFIRGDVLDADLLRDRINSHVNAAVIHFAGPKAVGEFIEKPTDYHINNVPGTIRLLQAM